jgi:hypothetical protein
LGIDFGWKERPQGKGEEQYREWEGEHYRWTIMSCLWGEMEAWVSFGDERYLGQYHLSGPEMAASLLPLAVNSSRDGIA